MFNCEIFTPINKEEIKGKNKIGYITKMFTLTVLNKCYHMNY